MEELNPQNIQGTHPQPAVPNQERSNKEQITDSIRERGSQAVATPEILVSGVIQKICSEVMLIRYVMFSYTSNIIKKINLHLPNQKEKVFL